MGAGAQGGQYPGAVSPMQRSKPSAGLVAMISSKMLRSTMRSGARISYRARSVLLAFMFIGALGVLCAHAGGEKELLAPTGHLRVGIYPGSPTSMVTDAGTGQTHGLTYDLGRELAARLDAPAEYVTFQRIADVVNAIKEDRIDFTVTNATPARANDVSFSQPLLSVELGYLVPANSPIVQADEIDRSGIRLGVTKGSTSERTLPASSRMRKSLLPRASSLQSRCCAGGISMCMPPTRPSCSKCRIRCRVHGSSMAIGDWSTWPSQFRKDASRPCRSLKALCGRCKPTDF